ncbi:hypothetical protein RHSIM_Rhsim03G0091200 [Rhododendron simsii]|uniref:C2H2-type domain-containing protein n=1 Tax=Rhododendron simsii TaxID=118357 RepID=A0A834LUI4_RHOSS|nr:hypothetical protein RHSIM_Rhsim03G0091200 [Rhododendron simsii]
MGGFPASLKSWVSGKALNVDFRMVVEVKRKGFSDCGERVCGSRDDAVYESLQKADEEKKPLPVDEDLPGMGQYYCLHCDRYFASVAVRDEHFKTKRHRKRVKQMMGPKPHTQLDADLAAGMGMPDNGPKLMSM